MRNVICSLLLVLFCSNLIAQAPPQGITFQAVARDLRGNAAPLRQVYVIDKIIANSTTGSVAWEERHRVWTNAEGVFTVIIGGGTRVAGIAIAFSDINWSASTYFFNLRVALEPTLPDPSWDAQNNYIDMGTTQFWSAPYAFYAARSGSSTFIAGSVNPTLTQGQNGDFYLNTVSYTLFGPKSSGGWGIGQSLIGPTGPTGSQGPIGLTGPPGPNGLQGLTGPIGPQGPQGNQGPAGPQGAQGPQGIAGADGKTVLNGAGNPANSFGNNGDFYINTTSSTLFGPKANGVWPLGISLVGPQGIQGVQGATGATGIQGPAGATGLQGLVGQPGVDGKSVLNGTSNPLSSTGSNGDFYINTTSNILFGPKASGTWPAGVSMVGPQGLLQSGSSTGNTIFWNGNNWVLNNSMIFNNGSVVGINTTNPDASAIFEISSNNKGVLIPRVTQSQRVSIPNPASGLLVFQTNSLSGFWYFDGSSWRMLANATSTTSSNLNTLLYTKSGF